MTKLSSYQKLKLKLEAGKDYIRELEKAIYEDDLEMLTRIKMRYQVKIDLNKALWFGEAASTSAFRTKNV